VDIPLLAESPHWRSRLDRILVVDCSVATQVQRVRERSGWTDAQTQQVIAQQATREQRLAIADEVIWNEGVSLQDLRVFVKKIWNHWQGL
jgi:dephospho-CoA kinase